uniref:Uncharacterized protein n=1 Tax=Eutreptiella gymnastica TaxID=73025 RepID=A0A7S4D2B7_9EUGL|mmetsp:Transcript_101238/g.171327  ORF Transcript_101238/g.171327 Transcript_101238/m.171327 type:complete len:107 (+) Transcript_101238:167-487(+)
MVSTHGLTHMVCLWLGRKGYGHMYLTIFGPPVLCRHALEEAGVFAICWVAVRCTATWDTMRRTKARSAVGNWRIVFSTPQTPLADALCTTAQCIARDWPRLIKHIT